MWVMVLYNKEREVVNEIDLLTTTEPQDQDIQNALAIFDYADYVVVEKRFYRNPVVSAQ